jgi:hypothetical protein
MKKTCWLFLLIATAGCSYVANLVHDWVVLPGGGTDDVNPSIVTNAPSTDGFIFGQWTWLGSIPCPKTSVVAPLAQITAVSVSGFNRWRILIDTSLQAAHFVRGANWSVEFAKDRSTSSSIPGGQAINIEKQHNDVGYTISFPAKRVKLIAAQFLAVLRADASIVASC